MKGCMVKILYSYDQRKKWDKNVSKRTLGDG